MRTLVNDVPVPEFDTTPFTEAPLLRDATVALVTTAALRRGTDPPWARGDESFRVLPDTARNLTVGHASPNWDRSGIAADLNVAYPIDRLHELAAEGFIGTVSPIHISFHGVIEGTLSTIRLDSGPSAARRLLDEGVNVVLLTPV
jgi:D-proline reductase (dithiol) PrdB